MNFRLSKQPPGKTLTRFHILDADGGLVGSANIPNDEVADFERCWNGPANRAAKKNPVNSQSHSKAAMAAAILAKAPKVSPTAARQALLRG